MSKFEIETGVPLPDRSTRRPRHDDKRWLELAKIRMANGETAYAVAKAIVEEHGVAAGDSSPEGKIDRLRKAFRKLKTEV